LKARLGAQRSELPQAMFEQVLGLDLLCLRPLKGFPTLIFPVNLGE
jgi:hypothetical protein